LRLRLRLHLRLRLRLPLPLPLPLLAFACLLPDAVTQAAAAFVNSFYTDRTFFLFGSS
jgi:hypothetical protein